MGASRPPADSRDGRRGLSEFVAALAPQYRTVGDLAYSVLRQAILVGELAPGEKLRQEELAMAIGISREPVRSAIVQLAADGLVMVNPHRGATVNVLSRERIREIYTLRVLLETHAVRLGIASMDGSRLAALERLGEELDRAERSPSSVRLRTAFYDALYDASRNPVLVEMIDRLRGDVGRYWSVRREASEHEHGHRPLLEYARQNDADGAAAWLTQHFHDVAEELVAVLDQEAAAELSDSHAQPEAF